MLYETVGQWAVFLFLMPFGAACGVIYMLLTALRKLLQAGIFISFAADIAFGLYLAALLGTGLVLADHGCIRLYSVAGFALGLFLFLWCAAMPLCHCFSWLYGHAKRLCIFISKKRLMKVIFR